MRGSRGPTWSHVSAPAISTSRMASTRCRVIERIRVAQVAPIQAPRRLPASRLTTTNQWPVMASKGTATSRAGRAVKTTIRLIALLTTTACRAAKPNSPSRRGSRKLGTAEADHAAEQPDASAGAKSGRQRPDPLNHGNGAGELTWRGHTLIGGRPALHESCHRAGWRSSARAWSVNVCESRVGPFAPPSWFIQ
jgi:hypothetical protein